MNRTNGEYQDSEHSESLDSESNHNLPLESHIIEAWTGNSKAFLFSPGQENTSPTLQATGLEKH